MPPIKIAPPAKIQALLKKYFSKAPKDKLGNIDFASPQARQLLDKLTKADDSLVWEIDNAGFGRPISQQRQEAGQRTRMAQMEAALFPTTSAHQLST